MNYLAHLYLSGNDEELLLGNFIADAVKGRQAANYSSGIARGIYLHRFIDSFTDRHPVVAESKARLREKYRKYAPVVADLYYDHFLAIQFESIAKETLQAYTRRMYRLINSHLPALPPKVQHFFPYMMNQNWLLGYAQIEGISRALTGLSRRTSFESNMETAGEELRRNYSLYQQEFEAFFPELEAYVAGVKDDLLKV
ncbi:MAG TPA: ACP phosphodiesterase [Pontibacter sp.]